MKLDEKKVIALSSIYHTDGYQVILDILESICNEAENDFIGEHPADEKAVLSAHATLRAQRQMFITFEGRIKKAMAEYLGVEQTKGTRLNPEADLSNLLSVLPDVQ